MEENLTIPVKKDVSEKEKEIIDFAIKIINTLEVLSYNLNIDYTLD